MALPPLQVARNHELCSPYRPGEVRTMGSKEKKPRATLTGRFIRGRRFDGNPLRRAADRAETVVLALLFVAFLVGAPLAALASGAWAHTTAQRAEVAQAASRHQVTAIVLTTPALPTVGSWGQDSSAKARWTAPDGTVVTGEVPVLVGTTAGATVPVWTTRNGQLTSHPLGDSQVASLTELGEITGAAAVALLLALVGVVARRSLDKRRMAAWDADWQSTGPRWTTRAP
jgi:hypothetical protein